MKLPRFLSPLARHYFMLWRMEKRENVRLRREHETEIKELKRQLLEWQNRTLAQSHLRPIPIEGTPQRPPETKPILRAPIGPTAKRAYLAEKAREAHIPTAEEILGAAEEVQRRA